MSVIVTKANAATIEVGDGKEYSYIHDAVNNANERGHDHCTWWYL